MLLLLLLYRCVTVKIFRGLSHTNKASCHIVQWDSGCSNISVKGKKCNDYLREFHIGSYLNQCDSTAENILSLG